MFKKLITIILLIVLTVSYAQEPLAEELQATIIDNNISWIVDMQSNLTADEIAQFLQDTDKVFLPTDREYFVKIATSDNKHVLALFTPLGSIRAEVLGGEYVLLPLNPKPIPMDAPKNGCMSARWLDSFQENCYSDGELTSYEYCYDGRCKSEQF